MTSTARDVMTEGAQSVSENDTVATAARQTAPLPLVGIISQGDLAQALPDDQTGQLVESISKGEDRGGCTAVPRCAHCVPLRGVAQPARPETLDRCLPGAPGLQGPARDVATMSDPLEEP